MRRLLLAAIPLVLAGCAVFQLVLLPFKLIFSVLEAIGEGVVGAVESVVTAQAISGPAPAVARNADGDWVIDAPREPCRFRVTVAARGCEPRTYVWPDDFADLPPDATGAARIVCILGPAAGR